MNQQVKTGVGTAVLIIIAITVGTFVWIYERDKSIETNVQIVKPEPIKKAEAPKVFDKAELEKEVFSAVELATKGQSWDKKIEVSELDPSQKAAKGFWWAHDQWSWIAWQKEDGMWNVEVDRDGFDCSGLKNIPVAYEKFFYDAIRFNEKIFCYDWADKISGVQSVNDQWNIYTNRRLGFAIEIPKNIYSYDGNKKESVEVLENGNFVLVTSKALIGDQEGRNALKNNSTKNDGAAIAWIMEFRSVKNKIELANFIQNRYGKNCSPKEFVKSEKYLNTESVLLSAWDGLTTEGCPPTRIAVFYSESKQMAVTWDLGQDNVFALSKDNYDQTDIKMSDSFHFID